MPPLLKWIRRLRTAIGRCTTPTVRWLNAALVSTVLLSAFIGNEYRSQDYDPMYMRDIVERQMRYGGSFYVNGIHNKGPLEPLVYRAAALFTNWNSYWFAISGFILLASLFLGWCASRVLRVTSGQGALGFAVGAAVLIHLTVTGADYAGVLYSRNMTVCLMSAAFVLLIDHQTWVGRRRLPPAGAALLVGALLGLSVQTLTTTALSSGVLCVAAHWMMGQGAVPRERRRRLFLMATSLVLTVVSAPLWYLARGLGSEFWNSWWVHGRFMSAATGRDLASQITLGWHQLSRYYAHRPIALCVVGAFAVMVVGGWRVASASRRSFGLALLGWWLAACLEITLTQRYSSHYFVVTTVPVLFMAAGVIGALGVRLSTPQALRRRAPAAALVAIVASLLFAGSTNFIDGLRSASGFHGANAQARRIEQSADGSTQSVRAVLDMVSRPGDPVLIWTNTPWSYLTLHRVSATRFIWKSFLMGEIYLGRTSPDYVLPGSWAQWRSDIKKTRPVVFVSNVSDRMDVGTEADRFVRNEFSTVYQDAQNRVDLRNDVASAILGGPSSSARGGSSWITPGIPQGSGWSAGVGEARYTRSTWPSDGDALFLSAHQCFRLDGVLTAAGGHRGAVVFRLEDPKGRNERRRLAIEADAVAAGSDFVGFGQRPLSTPQSASLPFSLVVGKDSAFLITEGHIGAAVRLQGPVTVSIESHADTVTLDQLRMGPGTKESGCGESADLIRG